MREGASNILVQLHRQGQQIERTHLTAVDIDQHLTRVEKIKQDEGLDVISNILGEIKEMALDMGSETDRLNGALDLLEKDVDKLNFRVGDANQYMKFNILK
ncbi:SNAP25 homologous protein SNAP33-like protein [Carex littledalei]|uniref:SNAP25 homologous protein SNAP33-like protein n=1 Tax=Carex littledalei TaxID=544730 RepID=A0A833VH16_9POAL|nr:SNAP25 homologous protein SNAP33-like protein [Carex littledalei]